jgi:hypothetical protein
MKQPKKQQASMTFDDLEHWVHEDVMLENEEPSAIATEVNITRGEFIPKSVFRSRMRCARATSVSEKCIPVGVCSGTSQRCSSQSSNVCPWRPA